MSRSSAAERAAVDSRRVRRVYEILARVYDDCFDWALGPGRRRAVATLPVRTGQRVLEVGVGTGLGLGIAQRIVRTHQGHIEVRSEPGETVMCVRLPVAPTSPAESSGGPRVSDAP